MFLENLFHSIYWPVPQSGDATPLLTWKSTILTRNYSRKSLEFWVIQELGILQCKSWVTLKCTKVVILYMTTSNGESLSLFVFFFFFFFKKENESLMDSV